MREKDRAGVRRTTNLAWKVGGGGGEGADNKLRRSGRFKTQHILLLFFHLN